MRPDGKRLVSAAQVNADHFEVKLWDTQTGKLLFDLDTQGVKGGTRCASFSPDGKHVAVADTFGSMKIWDADTGKAAAAFQAFKNEILSFAFHPEQRRFVFIPDLNPVQVWEWNR